MHQTVAILGFEPALQSSLSSLLGSEPGLQIVNQDLNSPDILLIAPPNPDWVLELHRRFPRARVVAVLEWHRRDQFAEAPIDEYVDSLAGYRSLVKQILASD
jgi:hypothetical protein